MADARTVAELYEKTEGTFTFNDKVKEVSVNKIAKVGRVCVCNIQITLSPTAGWKTYDWNHIASIPTGFVPDSYIQFAPVVRNNLYMNISIREDGGIYIAPHGNVSDNCTFASNFTYFTK